MKYLILISFLFLTILGNAQTIRVPWYEIEAAPDSGYIARSTSIDGDGAWYLPVYREGDTIAVWNPNTLKLEFRTKASILSGIPSGAGTTDYIPKWTSATTLGNSNWLDAAGHLQAQTLVTLKNYTTVGTPSGLYGGDLWFNTNDNLPYFYSSSTIHPIGFFKNTGNNIHYTAGNITIGSTSSLAPLAIVAQSNAVQQITRGHASQSANLQEWQTSGGTILLRVNSSGFINALDLRLQQNSLTVFRGLSATNAYVDNVASTHFQIGNSSSADRTIFTAESGNAFTRLGFSTTGSIFGDFGYTTMPAPTAILDIRTNSLASRKALVVRNGNGTQNSIEIQNNSGTVLSTIDEIGQFGYGTSNPTQPLHIIGNAIITGSNGTPTTVAGRDASGNVGIFTFARIIDSLIANGLITDNFANTDLTWTGNRSHTAANYSTTIKNLNGFTFQGANDYNFVDTVDANNLNIIRNLGVDGVAGQTIGNLQFQIPVSSTLRTIGRVHTAYRGDGTTRDGDIIIDVGAAGATGDVFMAKGNSTAWTGSTRRIGMGESASSYTTSNLLSSVAINGRSGLPILQLDSVFVPKFIFDSDGTFTATSYGNNNKTADDLSKTRSGLVFAPAPDGTLYETGGILFTQTADGTVANTVTETTIVAAGKGSATIPANYLEVGRTVITKATGYFTTDDAHTLQMRVDLGGVTIGDASGITLPDLATGNEHWELEFVFTIRTTGVSGTAIGQGKFRFCEAIGGATNPCVESEMLNTSTFTVDTTIANALDVTAQWGTASSTSSVTCTNLVIKAEN